MTLRAEFQKSYLKRYVIVAVVCLFMAAWFGYDGLVGYPQKLKYAEAFDTIRDLDATKRLARWKMIVSEKQWPADIPTKTAAEIRSDITGQYVWGGLNLLVGLGALVLLLRSRGAWVEATTEGLTTSWGQSLRFADVTLLDKKKWQRKGIAKATYQSSGERLNVFVFDDFKYQPEPLGEMLRRLESQLPIEKIVGGPPEAEPSVADAKQ